SSGLCGLIGAALYFGKSRGGQWGKLVYKQTSGWVISLVLIGFLMPNINNWGHAGGLVAGIVFGWVLGYNEKRKESVLDKSLALFFVGITVWLLARSVITGFFLIFT
ncbi:MAG: rhomboid family intramembrane serine protease, partial [Desulfobacula sp.]|nr:rhomboid family intramembrane serine protease [Desulfobacula sp.]